MVLPRSGNSLAISPTGAHAVGTARSSVQMQPFALARGGGVMAERVPLDERILMKGNEALAEAAIKAGCRAFFGYPITPASEISAYMAQHMGEAGGAFLQPESEISSVNMVFGAAGVGARAMTASSSPGISLMSEGISFLAGAELPCLLVNMMRVGPGLGGIQLSQADGVLGQMMEPVVFRREVDPADLPEPSWSTTGATDRPKRIIKSLYLDPDELEQH